MLKIQHNNQQTNHNHLQKNISLILNTIFQPPSITIHNYKLSSSPEKTFEEQIFQLLILTNIDPFWVKKILVPHNNYETITVFAIQFISIQTKHYAQNALNKFFKKIKN